MDNKGFTLIELVATIALLAIIAIISFVSINGVINQSRVSNCETLVNNIKSASKEYISDNRYNLDNIRSFMVSGNDKKYRVFANVLINGNYLSSPIIDPFAKKDSDKDITDSVVIIIELNNDYTVASVTIEAPAILKECKNE